MAAPPTQRAPRNRFLLGLGLVLVMVLSFLGMERMLRWAGRRRALSGVALTYVCPEAVARHDADKVDKRLSHLRLNAIAQAPDATHLLVRVDPAQVLTVRALMIPHRLEIRPVDEDAMRALVASAPPAGVTAHSSPVVELAARTEAAFASLVAPDGTDIVSGCDGVGDCHVWALAPSELDRHDVSDAEALPPFEDVTVTLTPDGAERFTALTSRLVGGRLAIVLDGHVLMAPVVQQPIRGGHVRITTGTSSSRERAEQLALVLVNDHTECSAWTLESEAARGP